MPHGYVARYIPLDGGSDNITERLSTLFEVRIAAGKQSSRPTLLEVGIAVGGAEWFALLEVGIAFATVVVHPRLKVRKRGPSTLLSKWE